MDISYFIAWILLVWAISIFVNQGVKLHIEAQISRDIIKNLKN